MTKFLTSSLFVLFLFTGLSINAKNWMTDPQPAILEVRYNRIEVYDTLKRDTRFTKEETMLRIGKEMSFYCSVPRYYNDSLMYNHPDEYWERERILFEKDPKEYSSTVSSLARRGAYSDVLYKNYPEGKVTETDRFDLENWIYEEDWDKPEWEISEESKDIIGYECFKATADYRGRKWIAWFTPEIPIQDGPWKLCGLPGLILEAHDAGEYYHFTANGLKQNGLGEVGFMSNKDRRKVTRDKFFNNWWKFKHSNFAAKMQAAYGVGPKPTNEKPNVKYDREETDYPHDL